MEVASEFDSSKEEDKVSSEGSDIDGVPSSEPYNRNKSIVKKLFNLNTDNISPKKAKKAIDQ